MEYNNTKIMFASDIHGSALYCKQLLVAFHREGAEKLFLLGDILYHGPRNDLPEGYNPKKTASMLNAMENKPLCVRGNCDAEVDQMVLNFPILAGYAVIYVGGRTLLLTHGHHMEQISPESFKKGDAIISGHTHILSARTENGVHFLNCGSVSLPKENNSRSYIVYENNIFTIKALSGECIISLTAAL